MGDLDWQSTDQGPTIVCCAREEKLNPLSVGPVVQVFTGLSRAEALLQVRRGMGIFAEDLAAEAARGMCEALRSKGVEAFGVPRAAVPGLGSNLNVVHVPTADAEAIHVQIDEKGTVKPVPWRFLATGVCTWTREDRVTRTDTRRYTAYAGRYGSYTVKERIKSMGEPQVKVTLVWRSPQGEARPMGLSERDVDYRCLGARMKPSAEENVMTFLGEILRWAKQAFFPEGWRAAARHDRRHITRVHTEPARDNYLRWAVCCAASRGLFRPQ